MTNFPSKIYVHTDRHKIILALVIIMHFLCIFLGFSIPQLRWDQPVLFPSSFFFSTYVRCSHTLEKERKKTAKKNNTQFW